MTTSTREEKAYAHCALLWVLSAVLFGSLSLLSAMGTNPPDATIGGLALSGMLFVVAVVFGARAEFVLGTQGGSTRLRRLVGSISAAIFAAGWTFIAHAYGTGGGDGVRVALRYTMPTAAGLTLGVIGAAASCLFVWESTGAVFEVRGAKASHRVLVGSVLSLAAATICAAALSGVVTGRIFLLGAGWR